jgi:hypothetical protein
MIALKKIYATPYLVVYWQQAGGLNPDVSYVDHHNFGSTWWSNLLLFLTPL